MSIEVGQLTESKRRVITLLRKYGPLSKRALTQKGSMGWATVNDLAYQKTPQPPTGRNREKKYS